MASSVLSQTTFNCRKRSVSTSNYEEKLYDDSEVSFEYYNGPAKKIKLFYQFKDEVENASVHVVDEDITFKAAKIPNLCSPLLNKPILQAVDEDITFKLPEVDAEPLAIEIEPRRSPNGYILPDPLPKGLVIQDLRQQKWIIGTSVGIGGFGEIYSAASLNSSDSSSYVIKVEPHSNGPLFVEVHYYLKAGNGDAIEEFKQRKNLQHFGIPNLVGTGWFSFKEKKFRFLVIPRFGESLQTILDSSNTVLSLASAANIAKQIVDCYEYIHGKGFVHKDVKGSNLLFSLNGPSDGKIYLVDYGLVSSRFKSGVQKPFLPDERCACEGTLEFCSRDAHLGCFSPRGDFEILLYNLIDWLGGKLPWEQKPQLNTKEIEKLKKKAFSDVKIFLKNAFGGKSYPVLLKSMMMKISEMKFDDTPDYDFFRNLFLEVSFLSSNVDEDDSEILMGLKMRPKPLHSFVNSFLKDTLSASPKKRLGLRNSVGTESDHEENNTRFDFDCNMFSSKINLIEEEWCQESMKNPTPQMLEIFEKIKLRSMEKKVDKKRHISKGRKTSYLCRSSARISPQKTATWGKTKRTYQDVNNGCASNTGIPKQMYNENKGFGMKKLLSAVSKTFFSLSYMNNKI